MRYLGIDYGRARIGIAVSDPEGKIAFPDRVIAYRNLRQALGEFVKIVREKEIGAVVVGVPMGLGGELGEQAAETKEFAAKLEEVLHIPIQFENEIFTTRMAEAHGKGKMNDASAAAIILQSYLDKIQISKSK